MPGDERFTEQHIKHLEMIQSVIARLGNDAFLVKGWAVTVSGVFFGLAINATRPALAIVSMVPTLMFWGLDTYFLRSERLFRLFYERARSMNGEYVPFGMDGTGTAFVASLVGPDRAVADWRRTAWRPTVRWLYLALIVAALAVAALASQDERPASNCAEPRSQLVSQTTDRC
jgi:hypothetical protein